MPSLTIRFLLISVLSVLFFSCKPLQIDGVPIKLENKNFITNSYFSNPNVDYVYKAQIDVYGNAVSGIFIAKKINETAHRIVFTTEFGNKLLDFEISENTFKVNYIVDDLNRKMIVNTLKEDFQLVLQSSYKISEVFENQNQLIYKSEAGKKNYFLFEDKSNKTLRKLVKASKHKEKVLVEFVSKSSTFAEKITITHKNIRLNITLNQIIN